MALMWLKPVTESSQCCWCKMDLQAALVKGRDPPSASAQLVPGNHWGWSRGSSSLLYKGKEKETSRL